MKLNKKVCMECYKKEQQFIKDENGNGLWTRLVWNIFTDEMWRRGHIWCIKDKKIISLDCIPESCEYMLEQKVIGQK